MITLGLVANVDTNGVYVSMPGSRGVLRGPYKSLSTVAAGTTVLVASTDDGEQVVVGPMGGGDGVYSVKSFGAKGDGVTDDTAAVQAAIDACAALTGGVVVLPAGHYVLTDTVTIPDGVTFAGVGKSPTTGSPTYLDFSSLTGTTPAIQVDDGSDVTVRDFYLAGRSSGSGSEVLVSGRRICVENLIVNSSTSGYAVDVGGAAGSAIASRVSLVTAVGAAYGFHVSPASTSVTLSECYANANDTAGYQIEGTYCALLSCASDTNGLYGYVLQGANSVGLYSCGAEGNGRSGWVLVSSSQVTLVSCRGVGNNTDGSGVIPSFAGVNDSSDKVTFIGCTDTSPTSGTVTSVHCFSGSSGQVTTINCEWDSAVHASVGIPDVTGSRGGNAALASLLTSLESIGLITDSSS